MKEKKDLFRGVTIFIFLLYLAFLSYLLFFSAAYGRTENFGYRYNLKPFQEIKRCFENIGTLGFFYVVINLAGNVVAFMPFGWMLPVISKKKQNVFLILFKTFLFSLTVEVIQLITKTGAFDVDDLLLNVIGGILGYLFFFAFFRKIWDRKRGLGKISNKEDKVERG